MKNVLIAGGAGFIGSNLSEILLKEGHKVYCVDNLITGSKDNISSCFSSSNFIFIEHDVIKSSPRIEGRIDYLLHLASPASPNKNSPRSYIKFPVETLLVNSVGTYNLLEMAREQKSRFIYASTSEVYGNPAVSPQNENYFGNVNPNGIRSVYDEGKRFGEAMVMAYFRKFGLDARIIRLFNTYGEKMQKDDGRVVSNFINQAINNFPITIYGDGNQTRSLCYITDMIDGILKVMYSDNIKGEVVNLGNPEENKIIDIAHLIKKLTASSSEIVFNELPEDDPLVRNPDIEKAKKLLGFTPKVSLEEGLKKTIEYFKNV